MCRILRLLRSPGPWMRIPETVLAGMLENILLD
jgi:hypothetical protein